jgi:hypothetical protein
MYRSEMAGIRLSDADRETIYSRIRWDCRITPSVAEWHQLCINACEVDAASHLLDFMCVGKVYSLNASRLDYTRTIHECMKTAVRYNSRDCFIILLDVNSFTDEPLDSCIVDDNCTCLTEIGILVSQSNNARLPRMLRGHTTYATNTDGYNVDRIPPIL